MTLKHPLSHLASLSNNWFFNPKLIADGEDSLSLMREVSGDTNSFLKRRNSLRRGDA